MGKLKTGIKLEIHLTNKWLYSLIAFGFLFLLGFGVWAYNLDMRTGSPPVIGHSAGEVNVMNSAGQIVRLQDWIDSGGTNVLPVKGISGDQVNGIIAFGGSNNRQIVYMLNDVWHILPEPKFDVKGLVGDVRSGIIVYGGNNNREVAYISPTTNWVTWNYAVNVPDFEIKGVTGYIGNSIIIYGGDDNKQIAYSADAITWARTTAPIEIKGMIGCLGNGCELVIYGGSNKKVIKYSSSLPTWSDKTTDFEIKGLAGGSGIWIIYGGDSNKQVAYTRSATAAWTPVANAPFEIKDITGEGSTSGISIFGGENNAQFAYMAINTGNYWARQNPPIVLGYI